jgi:hypothetical protein
MIGAVQSSQVGINNAQSEEQKKKDASAKVHQHLSTTLAPLVTPNVIH